MIIDFHTHLFPDKVAPKAIPKLADLSHSVPSYDGTKAGLYASMQRGGIDVSVILPVVTAPHQFEKKELSSFLVEYQDKYVLLSDLS